jgi:hypothetical protein
MQRTGCIARAACCPARCQLRLTGGRLQAGAPGGQQRRPQRPAEAEANKHNGVITENRLHSCTRCAWPQLFNKYNQNSLLYSSACCGALLAHTWCLWRAGCSSTSLLLASRGCASATHCQAPLNCGLLCYALRLRSSSSTSCDLNAAVSSRRQ